MEGFFSKKETESESRPDGKVRSCASCGLSKGCQSPKMKAQGGFKKGILNIGTKPTKLEDKRGKPFQNKAYKLLAKTYDSVGIDLHEDCLNIYAANCMNDINPTPYQIDCCRRFILKAIKKHKPKVIVLLGNSALYSVIGHRWKKELGKIEKWQGFNIPDQEFKAWICPTFSPDFVLNGKSDVELVMWKQDLKKVSKLVKTPLRKYNEPEIIYLEEDELSILDKIQSPRIAFDYETTGLKPHAKGHRIVCASVATSENLVYSFIMPKNRNARKPFTDLMKRESVLKIAANMKFEDNWTEVKLKTTIKGWFYDTMLAAHIIDNRPGITGLKFQNYIYSGLIDYDSEVSPYLKPKDDKNKNAINQIDELLEKEGGKELLLKYCALDSIFTYRMAKETYPDMLGIQGESKISPINSDFPNAYRLFHEGTLSFARAERHGFRLNLEHLQKQKEKLSRKIKRIERKIYDSDFFKDWKKHSKGIPSLNSGKQLGDYLYRVKKITPYKMTKSGKSGSTDKDSLKMLGISELDLMLLRNKYIDLKNKYLVGLKRECVNGWIHPFFHLHLVKTFRSSSSNPNFQNFPKRDPESMKIIRSCIFPTKGNQFLNMDFSGIEVAIGAAYHQDTNMIKYVSDPTTDMHGDMAEQIFCIDDFDKKKKSHSVLRGSAKNGFVFPQFYGDYYKNNAESICRDWVQLPARKWKKKDGMLINEDTTLGSYLISKGIKSYDAFENHLKVIEKDFWTERFPEYDAWRTEQWNSYQKNGYIPFKTGFVCKGLMDRKNTGNASIQGTAFHCTLWTFNEIEKELLKRNFKTRLIGQIHDDIMLDVYPPELSEVYKMVIRIATIQMPKAFTWINVPLALEAELCDVDQSWATKKEWIPDSPAKVAFRSGLRNTMNDTNIFYFYSSRNNIVWSNNLSLKQNKYNTEIVREVTIKEAKSLAKQLGFDFGKDGHICDDLPF